MTMVHEAVAAPPLAQARGASASWGFAELFVISQTALPALLYLPGTQPFRLPIRVSAFAISLAAFCWWFIEHKSRVRQSRAQSLITAIMALLVVMMFHPLTTSMVGGFAHIAVYFAVMAPLFWAPMFVDSPERLARLLWILLLCCGVNSLVGVLQVYDPGRWMPSEFSRFITENPNMGLGPVSYIGAHGQRLVRPPGLFDTPGAVAGPGMSAALLGLVFATSGIALWKRGLSLALALAGFAAIYLSQVRISLVIAALMLGVYATVAFRQKRFARVTQFGLLAGGTIVGAFVLALTLGGPSIQERVMTLFASDPISVYHNARGVQLDITFRDLLYQYPFGAGLARWGMAAAYFQPTNLDSPPLWAEIQFTSWMIDGGILLMVLYLGVILVSALAQWRLAMLLGNPRLSTCAAVVMSANLGVAALIFSFTPFNTQIGIQYWFLAGALHGVASRFGTEGS
jgi:hypothetical protein